MRKIISRINWTHKKKLAHYEQIILSLLKENDNIVNPPIQNTLVSIIMPAFNRGFVIKQAIDSVLAQTYAHWQLLIVDDGSTDNTAEIINPYLKDPRIHYFTQPHQGAPAARNLGLQKSKGEFIAYLDTDNRWYPYFLSATIQALVGHPLYESVYAAYCIHDTTSGKKSISAPLFDYQKLKKSNYIDLNVFIHKRELYNRKGGFDIKLSQLEDWDLFLRYCKDSAPLALPILGAEYLVGDWPRISTQHNRYHSNFIAIRNKNRHYALAMLFHAVASVRSFIVKRIRP